MSGGEIAFNQAYLETGAGPSVQWARWPPMAHLLAPSSGGKAQLDGLRLDLVQIATHELGDSFTPGWLTRSQVLNALRERAAEDADKRIDVLLDSRLLEEDSNNPGLMRIALDPIAEHLVARARMEY